MYMLMPKWSKRIDKAEKRGRFTWLDKFKAGQWRFCAIGEASQNDSHIKMYKYGNGPADYRLSQLGFNFVIQVDDNLVFAARKTMEDIESRVKQLSEENKECG